MWDNCLLGAQLSANAYKNAGPAVAAVKKLGFTHAKLAVSYTHLRAHETLR